MFSMQIVQIAFYETKETSSFFFCFHHSQFNLSEHGVETECAEQLNANICGRRKKRLSRITTQGKPKGRVQTGDK